jgi:RimJ/RimL family protein N-acetyltransferase
LNPLEADDAVLYQTRRLQVRHLRPGDEAALMAIYGDPAVAHWLGDGTPLTAALCSVWISVSINNYATQGYGNCAVIERATGEFIGGCGIVHPPSDPPRQHPAELIYALRQDRWGQGYATEMTAPMLQHGARLAGLSRILATIDPDNAASERVLRKLGMVWQHTAIDPQDGLPVSTWAWEAPD